MRRLAIVIALVFVAAACASPVATTAPLATQAAAATPASVAPTPTPTTAPTDAPEPALNGQRVTFTNGDLTLGGMVWKPAGNGPFKAVLWNHGSEKAPGADGSNPLVAPVFSEAGYVFFMPMRRGQGTSVGTWIGDALNAVPAAERPALLARLHTTEQLSDQLAGLAYLRTLPYVDAGHVAVAGWSFGGIQTVLGAGDDAADYLAAVPFTPASQSWEGNTALQDEMTTAATRAGIPFLFVQAENDYSLVPTKALTAAITASGGAATRSIYPPFGSTNQDGHEFAVRGSEEWTDEVLIFLANALGE